MTSLLEFSARAALCRRFASVRTEAAKIFGLRKRRGGRRLKQEPGLVAVTRQDEVADPRWWNANQKRRPKDVSMAEGYW